MKRRDLLVGATALAVAGATGYAWSQRGNGPVTDVASRPRLGMPPLLDTRDSGRLELTAMGGRTRFFGRNVSPTIGFNQPYLGPTIRMANGPLDVAVANSLQFPVSAHWHGLMVPGEHDGGPHLAISPGEVWRPDMNIDQLPGTAFYHTHVHERTATDVYAGLGGIIHVSDGRDDERGLPSNYGIDDLTIVLQDRQFDGEGRMVYGFSMMDQMHGLTGDVMVINGQIGAVAAVPRGVSRLRLINASNARIYPLFADDGRPLHLVATDGGFLPAPLEVETVTLSPGERVELLVDFSDGKPLTLMSGGDPNQGLGGMMGRFRGLFDRMIDRSFPVLPLLVDEKLPVRITSLPDDLGGELPNLPSAVRTRHFSLDMGMGGMMGGGMTGRGGMMGGFGINGRSFDMRRIDIEAERGSVERWIIGSPMLLHPFHIHGVSFQVVRQRGQQPSAENSGWKDTVLVGGETEILVRFDHPASREAPYMYHCHILEHEDGGMMGQLAVT
ncbi:multicopper oxidase domain-containing protein [Oricola cellulosilytica]|uniref:Biphenyl 2,3-dioxygenase n=1 Tax=Oricola cellulosilytica TaxID=1429082 RepID=A0A4R0PFN1_9HYPH|nr:multicopper oxidase domain-containing protein [Oricola cellulosilytica]TCD15409.1 biphenyl 2,3-dioxygenase [Oricola cellulosilytica]